jgi:type VII secretion integral membrane protein EccD
MATAIAVARRTRDALTAGGLGVAAAAFAAVAAAGAASPGAVTWIAVGAAVTVTGLVAALGARTLFVAFTALSAAGAILLGAASAGALLRLSLHDVAVLVVVLVVAVLPTAPRAAARVSGLRACRGTGDGDAALSGPRLQAALSASRRAVAVVAGLDAVFASVVSVGAVILVDRGDPWSVSLAVVGPAVVLLRARSVDVPSQVAALAAPAVAGLLAMAVVLALRLPPAAHGWLSMGAAVLAVVLVWLGPVASQRVWAPAAYRAINALEGAAIVALVPLAVAAVGGYDLMRHL